MTSFGDVVFTFENLRLRIKLFSTWTISDFIGEGKNHSGLF